MVNKWHTASKMNNATLVKGMYPSYIHVELCATDVARYSFQCTRTKANKHNKGGHFMVHLIHHLNFIVMHNAAHNIERTQYKVLIFERQLLKTARCNWSCSSLENIHNHSCWQSTPGVLCSNETNKQQTSLRNSQQLWVTPVYPSMLSFHIKFTFLIKKVFLVSVLPAPRYNWHLLFFFIQTLIKERKTVFSENSLELHVTGNQSGKVR